MYRYISHPLRGALCTHAKSISFPFQLFDSLNIYSAIRNGVCTTVSTACMLFGFHIHIWQMKNSTNSHRFGSIHIYRQWYGESVISFAKYLRIVNRSTDYATQFTLSSLRWVYFENRQLAVLLYSARYGSVKCLKNRFMWSLVCLCVRHSFQIATHGNSMPAISTNYCVYSVP